MIIVLGDFHIRSDFIPYWKALQEFKSWFHNQKWNKEENIFIQLGDFFHYSNPNQVENDYAYDFLQGINCNRILLLSGNHDFDTKEKVNAIVAFQSMKNVEIIDLPGKMELEGKTFCFLPWMPRGLNGETLKEYYENRTDLKDDNDFVVYHFADETFGFGTPIDLTSYSGKRLGGDIHKQSDNYVGPPLVTRFDERHQQGRIAFIQNEIVYDSVPMYFDFEEIEFGEKIEFQKNVFRSYDILNAPSKQRAIELYEDYHLHDVKVLVEKTNFSEESSTKQLKNSLEEYWNEFKTINTIDKDVSDYVKEQLFGVG